MDKKLFKSYSPPTAVKIKSSDSDRTVFEVMGVPYGGPAFLDGKDLHGERFTKSTDYGRDLDGTFRVKEIYAFYDHALNESIGKDQIGFAKFYQETDEGQVWEIEVMRAYRYHDMLLSLAQKGLLGASSQPVQTAVEIDYETGDIKRWPLAEISLTPTPANPDAVMRVMKSLNIEFKMEAVVEEDKNKKDDVTTETESEELPDLASVIEGAFEETPEDAELTDMKSVLAELVKSVATITAALGDIKAEQVKSATNDKNLAVEIGKVNAGLKSFALGVAKSLKNDVKQTITDLSKKSQVEQEIEDETEHEEAPRQIKSVIPAGAPGLNTKRSNQ